jgi:hypothetical protein
LKELVWPSDVEEWKQREEQAKYAISLRSSEKSSSSEDEDGIYSMFCRHKVVEALAKLFTPDPRLTCEMFSPDSEKSNSSDDDALKEIVWPEPRPEQSDVEEWNLDGEPLLYSIMN